MGDAAAQPTGERSGGRVVALRPAKPAAHAPSIAPRADTRLCARTALPRCALVPLRTELRRAAALQLRSPQ